MAPAPARISRRRSAAAVAREGKSVTISSAFPPRDFARLTRAIGRTGRTASELLLAAWRDKYGGHPKGGVGAAAKAPRSAAPAKRGSVSAGQKKPAKPAARKRSTKAAAEAIAMPAGLSQADQEAVRRMQQAARTGELVPQAARPTRGAIGEPSSVAADVFDGATGGL